MSHPIESLMSVRAVAAFFGVCRSTVYDWVHREVLPRPLLIGGVSRWKREDVERVAKGKRGLRKPRRD
jgi:excisionase family DNA binding protein